MIKSITKAIGESSFLGLVLAGSAVVVLAPTLKNVLRGVAVGTTKGIMALTDSGNVLASNLKSGWEDVVAEAKTQMETSSINNSATLGAGAGGALGATIGGMAGGPVGSAVGGGLGSVVGVNAGSTIHQDNPKDITSVHHNRSSKKHDE